MSLVSDSVAYNKKAGQVVKVLYPTIIHVFCIAHFYHNSALKIRNASDTIDKLISSLKNYTYKNMERKKLCSKKGLFTTSYK